MATLTQLPGELNLTFVQGDELQVNCDFDLNITGYTISNSIYITNVYAAGGGGSGFVSTIGSTVATFGQTVTSAANGTVLLALPEEKSSLLSPAIGYRWYLRWIDASGMTKTVLSGNLTVVNP